MKTKTNIYIVKRVYDRLDLGCCDGRIVEARSEKEAREMCASNAWDEGEETWLDESMSTCKELTLSGYPKIVMSDCNLNIIN